MENNKVKNILKELINEKFGTIRTVVIDYKVWFVGKDIAEILGYKNTRDALSKHCKGVAKHDVFTNRGYQEMSIIPESDVIRLATKSRTPISDEFEKWIFETVIPNVLKDGMYVEGEEDAETVEEFNALMDKAYERKILRKYGIGVRKDMCKAIKDFWNTDNPKAYAYLTNIIYLHLFGKEASELKKMHNTKKLRDEHFTMDELSDLAKLENKIYNWLEIGVDYEKLKSLLGVTYWGLN